MKKDYLFSFRFENGTQRSYVEKFLRETETDFFNEYDGIYADLFGENEYYRLTIEHVVDNRFEVYYIKDDVKQSNLPRTYPLRNKVISVDSPLYTVKLLLDNGSDMRISINGFKDTIKERYIGRVYRFEDGNKKVIDIEFLK